MAENLASEPEILRDRIELVLTTMDQAKYKLEKVFEEFAPRAEIEHIFKQREILDDLGR